MKFEYDNEKDRGECVAFIDDYGNLIVKNTDTGMFTIAMCKAGSIHNEASASITTATHRFYPGDKITITF